MPLFFKKIFSQKVTLILATVFVCVFLVGGYYTNVAVAVSTSPTYVEAKEASDTRAEQASSYERLKAAKNTTQEELTAAAKALDELTTRTNKIIEGYQAANASDIAKSNAAKKTPDTETQNEVAKWLGVGVMAIIQAVGYLLVAVINMVVAIVNYQGYATEAAVITGWNTVLGLCNMFFIVILLVIAFSTILRKESYAAKALLGKLLIAAIIINFSKTICGVIIEISSAFMMSMISDLSSGQIANLLGLQNFGSFSNTSGNITGWSTLVAALLSGIFLVISFVVLLMLLATLVMRVAMLWIYIVMSPLAYFLSSFPAGSKYAGQWWSEFTSQVITGPILCFFIWLAFKIQFVDNGNLTTTSNLLGTGKTSDLSSTAFGNAPAVANQASQCPGDMIAYMCPENFKKFIISIAFLIGGLIITQKAGGAAGKIAGAGLNAIKSGARRYTGYGSVADRVSGVMAKRATRRKEKTSKAIESWDTGISGALNLPKSAGKAAWNAFGEKGRLGAKIGAGATVAGSAMALGGTAALIGTGGLAAIPAALWGLSKLSGFIKGKIDSSAKDLQERRVATSEMSGVADNATGKINGVEYRKSADGKTFTATNASDDGTFKTIHALGEPTSRMLEGWNNGRADIKTMQSAKDQQKIDEHQKKMANLDTAQIKSILTSNLSSNDQKIAAGQILAEKDKISTKEEVEKIKAAIGNSAAALDRFNDALDKSKKSHLNTYDSETRVKRMKEGKINTSSLSSDALKDDNFMRDAYTAKGKNFTSVMKKVIEESEDTETEGLVAQVYKNMSANTVQKERARLRKDHVGITGNIKDAFSDANGNLDETALTEFTREATAKDYAKVKKKNLDELSPVGQTIIGQNISIDAMKNIARDRELAPAIKQALVNAIKTAADKGDAASGGRDDHATVLQVLQNDTYLQSFNETTTQGGAGSSASNAAPSTPPSPSRTPQRATRSVRSGTNRTRRP